ncbi:MAG: NnrS family protein [Panacagrimonas sp.]
MFTYAFRPLFLAAASWAIVGMAVWLGMYFGHWHLPTRFDPMSWHIHEMLFGFVMAAVGGFLLTAIANWTGRPAFRGHPLAMLTGLWLLGRIACLISAQLPAWLVVSADLSYSVVLLAVAAREIVAARNWRNLPMLAPVAVFVIANLLMHLESLDFAVPPGLGWRLGLAAPVLLISLIGGRIIPAFTHNWLSKRAGARLRASHGAIDIAAVSLLGAGLMLWAVLPDSRLAGVMLVIAAALNAWRLLRWAGGATYPEPLLFVLHVGYGWVAVGAALLGLSLLDVGVPLASAIHALSAGAIGTMILAVMPRVSLGHTGRVLTANRATVGIFALVAVAAITRVAAPWMPDAMTVLIVGSGLCWIAAFGLFGLVYGPMLLKQSAAHA